MNGKEKIYFLLDAIDDARTIAPSSQPVKIDPTNNLNRKYTTIELKQLFAKLEQDEKVLKVLKRGDSLHAMLSEYDPYDGADDGCWHIALLATFDQYYSNIQQEPEYQKFTGKKQSTTNPPSLPKYNRKTLEQIWGMLQEVEGARGLSTSPNNQLRLPCYEKSTVGTVANLVYETRRKVLEKLQSLNAIQNLHKTKTGLYNYWAFLIGSKYKEVYNEHEKLHKQAKSHQQTQHTKQSEAESFAYRITYSEKTREIIINNFLLANPDFDSENERVFTYIYKSPNKRISLKELQQNTGKLGKTLHKIVENLGFTGNIRKAFFDVSKTGIRFRNPVTKTDLDELGIKHIKLS